MRFDIFTKLNLKNSNMKSFFFTIITFIFFSLKAQKTYIPDDNFEQVLINLGYDNSMDDSVLTSNIDAVVELHFEFVNIESLIGIKDFSSLKKLTYWGTTISELDLSAMNSLEYFSASDHSTLSIDLSNNEALEFISFGGDQLEELDVSDCPVLERIGCNNSNLSSLDVSSCPSVYDMSLIDNKLTYLNAANGNNTSFTFFRVDGNPNLSCIQVDDTAYSNANWLNFTFAFDSTTVFSDFCDAPVNIVEIDESNEVEVFPNPTNGFVNIELVKGSFFSLHSILGQKIMQSGSLQAGRNTIDISFLENGVYSLQIITEQGISYSKKLVKQ